MERPALPPTSGGSRTFGTLLLNCLATLSGFTTTSEPEAAEAAVEAECFKDLERGLPRAKLLAELAPYCTEAELHEVEGLDKEDTVTEATEVVQAVASLPVTELLAVTPAAPAGPPAAAVVDDVDVKGPGDPA